MSARRRFLRHACLDILETQKLGEPSFTGVRSAPVKAYRAARARETFKLYREVALLRHMETQEPNTLRRRELAIARYDVEQVAAQVATITAAEARRIARSPEET